MSGHQRVAFGSTPGGFVFKDFVQFRNFFTEFSGLSKADEAN
jgi:hypothetical protein